MLMLKQVTSFAEIRSFRGSPYWMAPEVYSFLFMTFGALCHMLCNLLHQERFVQLNVKRAGCNE